MLELSYNLATDVFGLTGLLSHIVASLICTFVLTVFVLVVGSLVNLFESFQMRCLRKFFSRKTVLVICNYVTFVGTVIHELSHAFMAWAMGTKITEVRVFEIRDDNRLGHVNFKATGSKTQQRLQYTFISCAPVIFGSILVYLLVKAVFSGALTPVWKGIAWYYIISIADHMSMSSADRKLYLKGLVRAFPIVFFISWCLIYMFVAH
jgi:hypothetical protein